MPNAILTKLSMWEYSNGDAPFSRQKSSRVSHLCIWCISTCSHCDEPKPSKVLEHVDTCHLHMETNVTWWHGSRQSHHDDHAHNIVWICTYDNRLEHIPILQGQELSWLERAAHIAIRVHHTKCTITHTRTSIYIYIYIHTYIMHNAITQSKKVNQTLPMFQGYDPARYRKCKIDIAIPKERGLSME